MATYLHPNDRTSQEVPLMAARMKMTLMPRPDDAYAFLEDVGVSHERVADDEAEALGEEFVLTATSGEFAFEDARDEVVDGDVGFPFLAMRADEDGEDEVEAS